MSHTTKNAERTTADLLSTLAGDVMQKEVVTLSADATAKEAIELFEEYHISGAPVIDASGALVGVLSASDVARGEHLADDRIATERYEYFMQDPLDEEIDDFPFESETFPQEDYSPEAMRGETVRDWMSPHVVSVAPDADMGTVCETMVRESIHRVLVVENDRLRGILSTFDIVRFLANAGRKR